METTNAAYAVYPDHAPDSRDRSPTQQCWLPQRRNLPDARSYPPHFYDGARGRHSWRRQSKRASAAAVELIAWLSEFGAVVIRTFGFFIHSQMFLQALLATREAPAFCGNSDSPLMGLGFSEKDAVRLEDQLCEGGALVYVTCSLRARFPNRVDPGNVTADGIQRRGRVGSASGDSYRGLRRSVKSKPA